MQPALRHDHQQPDGLERDGLAAGVGAGDDHGARARRQVNIVGHNLRRVDQRVARLKQSNFGGLRRAFCLWRSILPGFYAPLGALLVHQRVQDRLVGAHLFGIFGLGKGQVDFGQRFHARVDHAALQPNLRGNFGQHPADFIALGQFHFAHFIVQFHHRQRFNEKGRAARGLVMHNGLDLALELGA